MFLSTDVFPQRVSVANYGELLSQRVEDLTKKAVLSQSGANWTNEQTSRPSRSCQWRQHHFSTKDVQTNTIHKHCAGYSVCNVFEGPLSQGIDVEAQVETLRPNFVLRTLWPLRPGDPLR